MRLLVTTSRMPFALDEIRKLGRSGHTVVATDTFGSAPGSHSRFAARRFVTPSPTADPTGFVTRIAELARAHRIDLVLPAFEESLHLARDRARLPTRLFAPSFDTLRTLHHKHAFLALARKAGLRTPVTTIARTMSELAAATRAEPRFFARPSLSRGGVDLFTNAGPLAGAMALEDCRPTADNPWLVQPLVEGLDVCTFSVVRGGRLAAHVTYVHPREIEHAGGIVFESVDEPAALAIARTVAEHTGYEGQLSLDLKLTPEGFVVIECNPRPTSGVLLLEDDEFVGALTRSAPRPVVAPAGRRRKLALALVRDMLRHPRDIPRDLPHLLGGGRDVYDEPGDRLPALYQLLSYARVLRHRDAPGSRHRKGTRLVRAYFDDVTFDEASPVDPT